MMKHTLTTEDVNKLKRAHENLVRLIDRIEETSRKRDLPNKPSPLLVEARQCLQDVLYSE